MSDDHLSREDLEREIEVLGRRLESRSKGDPGADGVTRRELAAWIAPVLISVPLARAQCAQRSVGEKAIGRDCATEDATEDAIAASTAAPTAVPTTVSPTMAEAPPVSPTPVAATVAPDSVLSPTRTEE